LKVKIASICWLAILADEIFNINNVIRDADQRAGVGYYHPVWLVRAGREQEFVL
jgi:hypothetical protein